MAAPTILKMIREENTNYSDRINNEVFYYYDDVDSGIYSGIIMIPNNVEYVLARLIISSGSAKIQTSTTPKEIIEAGFANWKDWDKGLISETDDMVCRRVNAIRWARNSGSFKIELIAY
jgi:hypothetical protein